jgi:D-tyrosyl-tRNA(Tyr) deacylase
VGEIRAGLLVYLGIGPHDSNEDIQCLARKILNLRIFGDEQGKMNLSLLDVKGELLIISQFTLYADCSKGHRPSFNGAASYQRGKDYYQRFIKYLKAHCPLKIAEGEFGAMMKIQSCNDGPVTIFLDTEKI